MRSIRMFVYVHEPIFAHYGMRYEYGFKCKKARAMQTEPLRIATGECMEGCIFSLMKDRHIAEGES